MLVYGGSSTDTTDIADTAAIRLTELSVYTLFVVFRVTTFTSGRIFCGKNAQDGNGGPLLFIQGTTEVRFTHNKSIANVQQETSNLGIVLGVDYGFAVTHDPSEAQFAHIYHGKRGIPLRETTYNASGATNGSGVSASTAVLSFGNRGSHNLPIQGAVSFGWLFKRRLFLPDLQKLHEMSFGLRPFDPDLVPDARVVMPLGEKTTGNQIDYSGYGHHGVTTGATWSANPWDYERRRSRRRRSRAPIAGIVRQMMQHHA